MNYRQLLSNTRIRCGYPRSQKPGDSTLLLLLSTQVQAFLNEANLTGRPWAVDELILSVSSATEDYPLAIDSHFGKPILVRTVYSADPGHIERDIDFVELGEFNSDWPFPKNFGSSLSVDSSPNNAARLAFFRKGGTDQVYVRVLPIPSQSADYQILYQVGVYGDTVPLDEAPLLPEHHGLIEVRTALALLPHCEWEDADERNDYKRKALGITLAAEERRLSELFRRYITTTSASVRPSYRVPAFEID